MGQATQGGQLPRSLSGGLRHEWMVYGPGARGVGILRDRIGGQHGVVGSGVALVGSEGAKYGKGHRYTGRGFTLPANLTLNYCCGFTAEAYVPYFIANAYGMLLSNFDTGAPYTGWGWGSGPVGNKISQWNSARGTYADSTTALANGAAYHIATTVNADGTGTHYLNGRADGTFLGPAAPTTYAGTLKALMAQFASPSSYPYAGSVSYVRLFDRALSARHVQELSRIPRSGRPSSLRGAQAAAARAYYYRNFVTGAHQ